MSKPARTIWVCPDLCNEPQTTRKEHEYMSCRHCRDVSGRPKSCMAIQYVRAEFLWGHEDDSAEALVEKLKGGA